MIDNLPQHYQITGPSLYTENGVLEQHTLELKKGVIKAIYPDDDNNPTLPIYRWPSDYCLLPSFIDLHIHGCHGVDVMDASIESLQTISHHLTTQGVGGFLATTMTSSNEAITAALQAVHQAQMSGVAPNLLGVHLEGPFLNPEKMGAQPGGYIQTANIKLFAQWQQSSGNVIRQITLAPEMPGAMDFIHYLHTTDPQLIISAGHSNASCQQARQAFAAGVNHCTHLHNAMSGLHHRQPGLATAVMLSESISAELIADGIHVAPDMLKLTVNVLGCDRLVLVTDAMCAQGLGHGQFTLAGQQVAVSNGQARLANGTLAGSVLRLDHAVKNLCRDTNISLLDAVHMASLNPARKLGIDHQVGSIAAGKRANLQLRDREFKLVQIFDYGRI